MSIKTMAIKHVDTIEEALALHAEIKGSGFFSYYENMKSSTIAVASHSRVEKHGWMVNEHTGQIYFVTEAPDHLHIFNTLTLCPMMNDSPFAEVRIREDMVEILDTPYMRDRNSRKLLALTNTIVTS